VVERRRRIARARGRRRRTALLAVLGLAAGAALLWWLATGPLLAVSGVSVSGYDREDRPALEAALAEAASEGTVLRPPVTAMRLAAARFPWVASVSVERDWPRGVSVQVAEAEPVAVAASGEGAVLVSEAGRVLGPVSGRAGLGWLRLSQAPPAPGYALPDEGLAPLAFVAAAGPEVGRRVRALRVDERGLLTGRLADGPELRLGGPERLAAKATALGLVLARLTPEEERAAAYVELSVPERPAVGGLEAPEPGPAAEAETLDP
jgi:cell division protein FtsQ